MLTLFPPTEAGIVIQIAQRTPDLNHPCGTNPYGFAMFPPI